MILINFKHPVSLLSPPYVLSQGTKAGPCNNHICVPFQISNKMSDFRENMETVRNFGVMSVLSDIELKWITMELNTRSIKSNNQRESGLSQTAHSPLSIRINTGSLYRNVSILNYKRDKDNVSYIYWTCCVSFPPIMTGYVADLSWKSGARAIEKLDRLRSTLARF